MTQQDELKVLSPEVEVTLSTGETLILKPFTFGQIPKALSLAKGISVLVQQAATSDDFKGEVMAVIAEGGEDLIKLVAFGIHKPREWFDTLPTDDGVLVTTEFLGVNFDFFTKKVMPQFEKGMAKFKASRTLSPSSLAVASPLTT